MSSSDDLKKDLYKFQLAVFENIHVALERSPLRYLDQQGTFLAYDVFSQLEEKWNKICQYPELSRYLDRVISLEHTGIMPVGSKRILGMRLVEDILDRQVRGLQTLIVHIDNDFGSNFANFFLCDKAPLVTKAPIFGLLIISGEPITLEEGVTLAPQDLPSHEFDFLTAHLSDASKPFPGVIFEHKWLEKKMFVESGNVPKAYGPTKIDAMFDTMVFVLRLVGFHNFSAPFVKNGLLAPGFMFGYRQFHSILSPSSRCVMSFDEIGERESTGLLQAWRMLKPLFPIPEDKRWKWLAIALRKMNAACERDNSLDRLLDLCICLEALLTRESQQVTYQFKERGAFLVSLGSRHLCEKQLQEVKKFLGGVYDMRSRLVHGTLDNGDEVEEENAKLFELARVFSLKSIALSDYFTRDEIIDNIDLAMVSPLTRTNLEAKLETSPLTPFWNEPYERVSTLFQIDSGKPSKSTSSEGT